MPRPVAQGRATWPRSEPAVDLDGAHAAITGGEQRVALRIQLFGGHGQAIRSNPERYGLDQGFEFMSGFR
jgi:hypothetical protein